MIRGTDRSQRNLEVMQMSSVSNCAALIGPIRVKQLAFMAEWTAVPRPLVDLTWTWPWSCWAVPDSWRVAL